MASLPISSNYVDSSSGHWGVHVKESPPLFGDLFVPYTSQGVPRSACVFPSPTSGINYFTRNLVRFVRNWDLGAWCSLLRWLKTTTMPLFLKANPECHVMVTAKLPQSLYRTTSFNLGSKQSSEIHRFSCSWLKHLNVLFCLHSSFPPPHTLICEFGWSHPNHVMVSLNTFSTPPLWVHVQVGGWELNQG